MRNKLYSNILCFGEVLWDMLPSGAKPGGAPLNVAIHLQKQGENPLIVSKIGTDKEGEQLILFLQNEGLNVESIQKDKKLDTSKVLVHLDKNRNATYEICEPVAWDNIKLTKELQEAALNAELIIFGTLASRNAVSRETLFQIIENSSATKLLDVNLRPPYKQQVVEELLHKANFIKLNDDELAEISTWNKLEGTQKEKIKGISTFYKSPTVCVTRGSNGAILYINNKFYDHPGYKVHTSDTVGAGDSFLAGLVANLSKKVEPAKALEYACATGAFVASKQGAVPAYSEKEINTIIKSGNK